VSETHPGAARARFSTVCTGCLQVLTGGYFPFCPHCSAMSDVTYDLQDVRLRPSHNPYRRFFDLLPVSDERLLPAEEVFTPTVHAQRLGARLGLAHLYLKNETVTPTRTTKDRMAAVALAYLYECGVRRFTTSSTGNSSSAYAHAISRVPELVMYVVTAEAFRERVALGGREGRVVDIVARDASFVDAFRVAGELADERGWAAERGFFNPGRREGLKLAWLEAVEQVDRPVDWYVQAVSSAMGVYGVYKAARELEQLGVAGSPPRLLCVQQESCAPMVTAWRGGSDHIRASDVVPRPAGIATAILRGDPTRSYPHVRRIVAGSGGTFAAVADADIRAARQWLAELEGINVCFAAAAAVAGLAASVHNRVVSPHDTVLVNLTGAERPLVDPTGATLWLDRNRDGWNLTPVP
jgi:threonine synthase